MSDIDKALAFEWICQRLDKKRFELIFILLGKRYTTLENFLYNQGIPYHHVIVNTSKKSLLRAWWSVFAILRKEKPDVVHTHLFKANIVGLSAAWLLRVKKRIYTRHHGSLHHNYFPLTVYLDKFINKLTTHIIVLCGNNKKIVVDWEKASPAKVFLIPHGFDFSYFQKTDSDATQLLRKKYVPHISAQPVIGVIARYIHWKGVQYIIPAFNEILKHYPNAYLILANTQGNFKTEIKELLQQLPKTSYTEIEFEQDIATLYKLFDIYIHVPIDEYSEAFGQTYVEALISGVPSIFSKSGIACDFIQSEYNAIVVDYRNSKQITQAIVKIMNDSVLRESLIREGKNSVSKRFELNYMIEKLENLYDTREPA